MSGGAKTTFRSLTNYPVTGLTTMARKVYRFV
jgi:hypothetical protein